jgi:hypothetical protein
MSAGTGRPPRIVNPIAERRLAVVGEPGREFVIVLGKPRRDPDPTGDWMCPYFVEGLSPARRRFAHGADSLQALQMAIEAAKYRIEASGLVCTWADGEPGDIGVPRTVPTFEGSGFAQKIGRIIDRELKKFARVAKARSDARHAKK